MITVQRLLNEEQILKQGCQGVICPKCLVKITKGSEILKLLIAIQSGQEAVGALLRQDGGDLPEPWQIQMCLTTCLDFEVTQAIGADGFIQGMGESVVELFIGGNVPCPQRIAQADRVAHGDTRLRFGGQHLGDRDATQGLMHLPQAYA